jgi:hypothetical protein
MLNKIIKKAILIILLIGVVFSINAQSPEWSWVKSIGGLKNEYTADVITDENGNIIVKGLFESSSITFGATTLFNAGGNDIFIVKYDPNGNILWAKSIGGNENEGFEYTDKSSICSDASGNIFVTYTLDDSRVIFILKYDPNGNILWVNKYGGQGFASSARIYADSKGNVTLTGKYSNEIIFGGITLITSNFDNIAQYIVKFDSQGNILWAQSFNSESKIPPDDIFLDSKGNTIVLGRFSDSISFGAVTLKTSDKFSSSLYVLKYDLNGNVIWAKSTKGGAGSLSQYSSIFLDTACNIFIAGEYSDSISFGSIALKSEIMRDVNCFVAKYDPNGNVKWAKSYGGSRYDFIEGIVTDVNGNVFIAGGFMSPSILFGSTTLVNTEDGIDLFVVKLDPSGSVIWAKSSGDTEVEYATGISIDRSNNIILAGLFNSPKTTFGATTLINRGGYDVFLAKLSSLTSVNNIIYNTVKVYPNPSNSQVIIDNGNYSTMGSYSAKIVNALGQQVFQSVINQQQFVIDAKTMGGAGVYTFYITDANNKVVGVKKIVLQ